MTTPRRDEVTGVDTTGHDWDGIEELDNPLPRWWLWVFYACVVWSIAYWILMPAWPLVSDYTKGMLGYSQRTAVANSLAKAEAKKAPFAARLVKLTYPEILKDAELLNFAFAGGRSAFAVNCSQCHGSGANGSKGYPNLNDDAWLWGGRFEDIERTIRFGVRTSHPDTRTNPMPAFGRDGLLTAKQIDDVVAYVLVLSGQVDDKAAATRGTKVFAEQCTACHGKDGKGNSQLGAPNLTDRIWLFGGTRKRITESVLGGRGGIMPAWQGRLDAAVIRQIAIFTHGLGGGR